jgi:hypothetical protein
VESFAVGERVTHDAYGLGRVVGRESAAVTVDFGAHRTRITSPFVKLSKL